MSLVHSDPTAMRRVVDCVMRSWFWLLEEARRIGRETGGPPRVRVPLLCFLLPFAESRGVDFYEMFQYVVDEYRELGDRLPWEMHELVEALAWDIETDGKPPGVRAYLTPRGIEILPVGPDGW